jgi:hypothetical protein
MAKKPYISRVLWYYKVKVHIIDVDAYILSFFKFG